MDEKKFLTYKGYPLVRNGKKIYYGNMYDPFVVFMQIASVTELNGQEVPDKILVQLLNTAEGLKPKDVIVKSVSCKGFSAAMQYATVWLENANAQKN